MPDEQPPQQAAKRIQSPAELRLRGQPLDLELLDLLLGGPLKLTIEGPLWEQIERSASAVARIAAGSKPAYGINTGFGSLCRKRIAEKDVQALQQNLILSHAVGVGPPAPPEVVRWMMLFKVHALTHGVSGVSRATLALLQKMLNADLLPVVPTQGSLGASGDLAPLAHMVLPMLGFGQVHRGGHVVASADALAGIGAAPITLGPKEGLALINGTQFMAAYAAIVAIRATRLAKCADIIASMSLEGLAGSAKPFDERLNRLRPHPGAIESAGNVRRLLEGSGILPSHADCDRVQDPYSVRCIPQVHGAARDALRHARGVIETEINSVTDNPLIFEGDEVISGGLFHGEPLALVLDYLAIALSELASISERRIYLLLSGIADLPVLLMRDTGINSGLMIPQYTAAALVSENKGLCTPASVDSIPTSLGQEDHVSMGARAACKAMQVLDNAETVLSIEQMCAAQALDFRAPLHPGRGPRAAHALIRGHITHADSDRLYGDDIQTSLSLLRSGRLLAVVEAELGRLQ